MKLFEVGDKVRIKHVRGATDCKVMHVDKAVLLVEYFPGFGSKRYQLKVKPSQVEHMPVEVSP